MGQGKQMVIRLVEMVTGGLVLCFCLLFLWGDHGESLLKSGSQRLLEAGGAVPGSDGHRERLSGLMSRSAPVLKAEGIIVAVGEPVSLWELLLVQEGAAEWRPVSQQEGVTGCVMDFYDGDGERITPLCWQADGALEEISSVVGYDRAGGQLIFFSGGSYRVAVSVRDSYGRRTEAMVTFLAEVK